MERVVIAVIIAAIAIGAAMLFDRRGKQPTSGSNSYAVPSHIDRREFPDAAAPWLVVAFTSSTCDSCAQVRRLIDGIATDTVAVFDAELVAERALHDHYGIEAVPTVIVADAAGEVRASFLGVPPEDELQGVLAGLTRDA